MKIRITDKSDPNCGKEFEGDVLYYDILHGRKINGKTQDLYVVNIDGEQRQYYSRQIDEEYYHAQRQAEVERKMGMRVGDIVRIVKTGSGSFSRDFFKRELHTVTEVCWTGNVTFDGGEARMFRPQVEVVGHKDDRKEAQSL